MNSIVYAWIIGSFAVVMLIAAARHVWVAFDRREGRPGRILQAVSLSVGVVCIIAILSHV